jgi:hypothetical protein
MKREFMKSIAGDGERFAVLVVVVLTTHVFQVCDAVTVGEPTALCHIPEDSFL